MSCRLSVRQIWLRPIANRDSDGWRCLRFEGVFDLSLTGVLSSILSPLAASQVSVFAISTFDTDYVLVRETDLSRAIDALTQAGHRCQARTHFVMFPARRTL